MKNMFKTLYYFGLGSIGIFVIIISLLITNLSDTINIFHKEDKGMLTQYKEIVLSEEVIKTEIKKPIPVKPDIQDPKPKIITVSVVRDTVHLTKHDTLKVENESELTDSTKTP